MEYNRGILPKGEKWDCDGEEWCTIWYPLSKDNPDIGPCFDFPASDIDAIIALLQEMKKQEGEWKSQ